VPKLKKILGELIPGSELVVEMAGNEVIKFELANPPELNISKRDFEFLRDRALEVLSTSLLHDQQKQDINFAQQHDTVTGLANRSAFNAVLESKAATVNLQGGVLGLYYLDIDRFGDLNSSLGYQMGDLVLLNMGFRISDTLRSSEFAARLASDEFAIVGIYKNETEARSRALELQAHFNFEMDLNDAKAAITVSMGCAISHSAQADVTDLPRCAALAIHLAKKLDRRSSFVTYNSDDHSHLMNTWQDEIAVRNALATGEFKVYFQPIVSLSTRKIVGFEALIRWQRPGLGIIYPDQFLPLVNSAGLTVAVGADVFVESIRAWKKVLQPACAELGLQDPYISINMEALQLQDESFVQFVLSEIDHAEIPHGNVQLEVTEHALVGGEKVTARLEQFRATGIRIALDDFGTGYSNLAQTLKLPLDVLKLDKSLLLNVEEEEKSLRMIEDIVQLAHGQDFTVIAEGVESERIAGLLARMEVDRGQGYLFGRAMAADQIHSWVHKHGLGQPGA
jgi:diguanylate cyclase (GGDEF)-like protein